MRSSKVFALFISVVVILIINLSVYLSISNVEKNLNKSLNEQVVNLTSDFATDLNRQINHVLSALDVLGVFLSSGMKLSEFDSVAKKIIPFYEGLDCLQLAPNGVVQYIYPLEDNKGAMGHDLLNDPQRRADALRAIETKEVLFSGPLNLIQGGVAIIARKPIYDVLGKRGFWGFAIALVRFNDLINNTHISRFRENGFNIFIFKNNDLKNVVFGKNEISKHYIDHKVSVPGSTWTVRVSFDSQSKRIPFEIEIYIVCFLFSIFVGVLTYKLVDLPNRLKHEIRKQTVELEKAHSSLQIVNAEMQTALNDKDLALNSTRADVEHFVKYLANDFRTPIKVITGYAKILEKECKDNGKLELHQYLEKIYSASVKLDQVIDSLLLLNSIHLIKRKTERVHVENLIFDVINKHFQNYRDNFEVKIDYDIISDPEILEIAFVQIFSNSIKFNNPNQKLVISISLEYIYDKPVILIRDNGIGFDSITNLNQIFKPFTKFHYNQDFAGHGVGLALAHKAIKLVYGDIWVDSLVGEGTKVFIQI